MTKLMTLIGAALLLAGCGLALPPKGLSMAGYTVQRADCAGTLGSPQFLAAYARHNGATLAAILQVLPDLLAGSAAPTGGASASSAVGSALAAIRATAGNGTLGSVNVVAGLGCAEIVQQP